MDGTRIDITSIVSQKDGKPYVQIVWGEMRGQMTPEEARQHADAIMQVAFAADADAFLVDFCVQKVGVPKEDGARLMHEFREWRKNQTKTEGP